MVDNYQWRNEIVSLGSLDELQMIMYRQGRVWYDAMSMAVVISNYLYAWLGEEWYGQN